MGLVHTPDSLLRCSPRTIVAQQDHRQGASRYDDQNGGQRFRAHHAQLAMFGRNDSSAIPARVKRSANVGIRPVAASAPSIRPSGSMLATSNLNNSCIVTVVSSIPTTSLRSEEHTSELQSRGHLVCRL